MCDLPTGWLSLVIAIGSIGVMIIGLIYFFARLKAKEQGFAPNSLKALGLILFIPTILLISVAVPNFQSETLAALLGVVAGYVLSYSKKDDE